MDVLILGREDVQRLLEPRALLTALSAGFRDLALGRVLAPGRNELAMDDGAFLLGMPGRRQDGPLVVKVVTVAEANPARGLPSHLATIGVYDPATGVCRAFLDGTAVTAARTSATAALGADVLARHDARVLTVVGGGVQAEHHLRFLPLVRDFDEVRVTSLHHEDAERLAAAHPRAIAVRDAETAVRGADVVTLATHAPDPVIDPAWIAPGTHVGSVGYCPPRGELPVALAREHRLVVETRRAFEAPPVGCAELAGMDPGAGIELGEILLGRAPGRTRADEITVFKTMGHAVEDVVATELVVAAAEREGAGVRVTM